KTLSPGWSSRSCQVYTLLTGLYSSIILFVYTRTSIVQAFGVTAGMFAAMSVYGRVTTRDITGWGSFLFMGVIGLIIASVLNMFLHSSALEMAVASIGVFIFTGVTAYKTQSLKRFAQ